MKYLLVSIGVAGNTFPLIGVGRALKRRGHDVHLMALGCHRRFVEDGGLVFHDVPGVRGAGGDRRFYHPVHGLRRIAEDAILPAIEPVYEHVAALDLDRWTVLADQFSLGARVARERTGAPLISCVVSPWGLRSQERAPLVPRVTGRALAPMSYAAAARLWDQALGPVLNAFRARLGLAPVSDIFYGWSLSPHRIVGLFPEWYAPRARDWPPHFVYGGFSSYDQSDSADVPADLQQPGDPIVVYCAGSAGAAGQTFFDAAVDAGRARRWRAVLLGASAWAPTRALPENVRRYDFVPLSRLLPIAAAVVHHGGLGTLALALAAGTPQIIVPMGHDHYENGRYLERLGVGRAIFDHREQSGEGLRARLEAVLQDGPLRQRCQLVAARARAESSLAGLCAEIEGASVTRAVQ